MDTRNKIVLTNTKAAKLLQYGRNELIGCSIENLIPLRFRQEHEKKIKDFNKNPAFRAMSNGRVLPVVTKDGKEIETAIGLSPLNVEGQYYVLVSFIETSNQILKVGTFHDPLTGLPNRNLFKELSENIRNMAIRSHRKLTIMFIDLDNFKIVNDRFGHHIGDLALCEVANLLTKIFRKNDVVARLGGDEFVACLYDVMQKSDVKAIAQKIIDNVSSLPPVEGNKVRIGASIGAASFDFPFEKSLAEMIDSADKLMYEAKASGKGRVAIHNY